MTRKYRRWENRKDELQEAVDNSDSIAEVCRYLGLRDMGGNFQTIRVWLARHEIDYSHFSGQAWNKDNFYDLSALKTTSGIRKNLIRTRGNQCENCNRTEWEGYPIKIEMHHIDGDRTHNEPENLQLLCPNCHAYTDNYRNHKRH